MKDKVEKQGKQIDDLLESKVEHSQVLAGLNHSMASIDETLSAVKTFMIASKYEKEAQERHREHVAEQVKNLNAKREEDLQKLYSLIRKSQEQIASTISENSLQQERSSRLKEDVDKNTTAIKDLDEKVVEDKKEAAKTFKQTVVSFVLVLVGVAGAYLFSNSK